MVGIVDESFVKFPISSRIRVNNNTGTVKYVGEVNGYDGIWIGVEWDDPSRGKHNGTVNGQRYFQTGHPTSGSFVRVSKVSPSESLEEAARERYLNNSGCILDQKLLLEAQAHIQASLMEIVGMDKIARKQSKLELLTEISVDGSNVNSAGYLMEMVNLTTLNLSHTLMWNWSDVAKITSQVPTLVNLNLSCNRMKVPTNEQIVKLENAFRNLEHINLGNCGYKNWDDVKTTAKLWPNIRSVGLQENDIAQLTPVDCMEIFKNLRDLDLHRTKLSDFNQIVKLGNIKTLNCLNLMENGIEEVKLPDCDPAKKLNIFIGLAKLNLFHNPIYDEIATFNELDKLPTLENLSVTPHLKSDFDEMFSKAIASIPQLKFINKIEITKEDRRGAEYDIWKKFALDWMQSEKNPELKLAFYKKHRSYPLLLKKYGSPAEFVPRTVIKVSNLIKLRIQNKITGEVWEKKVPRKISVQTLQGLIIKHFKLENTMPKLSYADAKHPDLVVELENSSKNLDFYSILEGDTVTVEW